MINFNFPIEDILCNEKMGSYCHHYCYSNGEYTINFSHNENCFNVNVENNNDRSFFKTWEIHSITKSALNKLETSINKFLNKHNITNVFYDIWGYREYKIFYQKMKESTLPNIETKIELINCRGDETYNIDFNSLLPNEEIILDGKRIITLDMLSVNSKIKLINYLESLI